MAWVAFYPRTGDAALEGSAWMAHETVQALGEAVELSGNEATRAALHGALSMTDIEGVAFFCHGSMNKLFGSDGSAALDEDNLHLLRDKWGHAVACHSGDSLPEMAVRSGATCFVGYDRSLIVEWDARDVPPALLEIFSRLVTETTRNLRQGIRSRLELQRRAGAILDELRLWLLTHPDEVPTLWIEATAQQLVERMVVR